MFHSTILAVLLSWLSPVHPIEDGVAKQKVLDPIECSADDACNTCQSESFNDHCLTCRP
jgi:hypothetical protein